MSTPDAARHRHSPAPSDVHYEIRVVDHLDDDWSAWFDNLTIAHHADGTSTLTGPITDQAQLHGILARLRDVGSTLLSVHAIDDALEKEQSHDHLRAGNPH